MKSTKGFTLIELLAVIVILAIIALIAVPVIMGIIRDTRKAAAEDSVYGIIKAAELYYAKKVMETGSFTDTMFVGAGTSLTNGTESLDFKGTIPTYGTVLITSNGKIVISNIQIDGFICNEDGGNKILCQG